MQQSNFERKEDKEESGSYSYELIQRFPEKFLIFKFLIYFSVSGFHLRWRTILSPSLEKGCSMESLIIYVSFSHP